MRLIVILILFLLTSVSTYSQSPSFKKYTVEDGLPSNEVYHVIQDKKGYIWFATDNGVSRFDGYKFQNFDLEDGLPDNTMVAAEKSNLFFGTGLLSDQNEVKVIDMADIDGSQNVRVVMRFTAGVQYGIGSDIVLYS